jgi:hypothetical protein
MNICIDYDGTYTADRVMWDEVIATMRLAGHDIWCVTARGEGGMAEVRETAGPAFGIDRCVGTNGEPKRDHLFKTRNVYGDIWIDDMPETVTAPYARGPGGVWVTQYDGGAGGRASDDNFQ